MQYADKITWISSNNEDLDEILKTTLIELSQNNLTIHKSKTEQYCITGNHDPTWKKCKYLGSVIKNQKSKI